MPALSQNFVWVKTFGGPTYDDWRASAIDPAGNVIAVGSFSGTIDFDPGVGVFNMTSTAGGDDIFVMKLTPAGAFVWARKVGTATDEYATDVIVDAASNVYITGGYKGTVDFDPGAGITNLISAGNNDAFVWKLNSAGNFLWAKSMGGAFDDDISAIELDAANTNVYVTGTFQNTADMNPAAATNTLIIHGLQDAWVGKYDVAGNYVWAVSLGGASGDYGYDLKVSATNNYVYCIGGFSGSPVNLSPGCACPTYTSQGSTDIYMVKLTCAGGGFNSAGTIGGAGTEFGVGITLDAADNIYLTGQFSLACDMDPGPGTVSLASLGSADGFVEKLSSTFVYQWANKFGGTSSDAATEIDIDPLGNLYVTGNFNNVVDFDPSAATYTLSANGTNSDCYVMKLDNNGGLVWAKAFGSNNLGDYGSDIDLDAQGNVYTVGTFWSTVDFDPGAAVTNSTAIGQTDGYIHKLSCTLPSTVSTTAINYTLCASTATSSSITFTPSAVEPLTTYGWSVVGAAGVVFSPVTGTTTTMSYTASTTFSVIVTATNACGTTTTSVNKITVNPLPTVSGVASPTAVCTGSVLTLNGAGASTYTWSSGVTNNTAFTPGGPATYTVTGTNANGCKNSGTIAVSALPDPTVTISGTSPVCLNQPTILTASGAGSYTWMPGSVMAASIVAQPLVNTTYTVSGTAANGCNNYATFALSLITPPKPDICMVTVDSLNQYNEIYWDETLYPTLDSMIIYREVSTNTYKRIGAVSKTALSFFVDTMRSIGPSNGDPNITTYRYKIQARDMCGNYGAQSFWHNTVYFSHTAGNFFWSSNYMIETATVPSNPVITYSLMVCINPTISPVYNVIGVTAGNQFNLNDPGYATYSSTADWRVYGDLGYSCNATLKTSSAKIGKSRSNIQNNRLIGIKEISLKNRVKVYPNPAQGVLNIDFENINENVEINLVNVLGQTIYSEKISKAMNVRTIDISGFAKGVYTLSLSGKAQYKVVVE